MRHTAYLLLAALACIMPTAVTAQQTKLLTADKHNEYGLVYSLPVTELRIEVTSRSTIRKAGPYWQYAKKFIGTDNVVREDEESWSIENVEVTSYGVADPENRYLMQLKAGATTYIAVADDGMILAVNTDLDTDNSRKPIPARHTPAKAFTGKEYLQYVGEDFLASQSSAKQAQLLAESLMEVRDAKISLTRGTAETMPTDGRQLELMLASLSDQEAALTAAFAGTETTRTETRTFTFRPQKEGRTVLFRLSDFAGFTDPDDYSGEPVYIRISEVKEAELPKDANGEVKKLPKDAVVYVIPGSARITLSEGGETLFSSQFEFAQFGSVFGLSPSIFTSKKEPSYAVFDPATGALREIGEVK